MNLSFQKSKNILSSINSKGDLNSSSPGQNFGKNPSLFRQLNPLSKNLKILLLAPKLREEEDFKVTNSL